MTRVFSRCFFGGVLTALLVALAAPAFAGGVVYTSWGKAIGGYDPVAYFTDGSRSRGFIEVYPRLHGSHLAFCQRQEPRCLRRHAGKIRASIWRVLRLGG